MPISRIQALAIYPLLRGFVDLFDGWIERLRENLEIQLNTILGTVANYIDWQTYELEELFFLWLAFQDCPDLSCIIDTFRAGTVVVNLSDDTINRFQKSILDSFGSGHTDQKQLGEMGWDLVYILNNTPLHLRDKWVREGRLLPPHPSVFDNLACKAENQIHPAQLFGECLAEYIRTVAEQSERPLNRNWNRDMMTYLPDLNSIPENVPVIPGQLELTDLVHIDPFHPFNAPNYLNWWLDNPIGYDESCEPIDTQVCNPRDIYNEWALPWSRVYLLPFLPSSALSGENYAGRPALAQGTLDLWESIGINTSAEEIARWINSYEHGSVLTDPEDIRYLEELIHYSYVYGSDGDLVVFLAKWSAALFNIRGREPNGIDTRDDVWLQKVLSPPLPAFQNSEIAQDRPLDWDSPNQTNYVSNFRNIIGENPDAYRTFGSGELNPNLRYPDFITESGRGVFWQDYVGKQDTDGNYISGVFIMTGPQLNCARFVARGATLAEAKRQLDNGCNCDNDPCP